MKVDKNVINRLIEEKWKKWEVKYVMQGSKPVWNLKRTRIGTFEIPKRTADCVFCGKHKEEESPGIGFFGWAIVQVAVDEKGKYPEVCPQCLNKVGKKLTVSEPRIIKCTRCDVSQKEKIFGMGFPGWIRLSTVNYLGGGTVPMMCPNCYREVGYELGPKFIRGTYTALTYAANSLLTSTKMTQNQANFAAVAAGDSGAPTISADIETAKGNLIKKIDSGDTTYTIVDDSAKVWRAVYNDLAELMPHWEISKPGDVLIWKDGKVCPSKKADDKRVIGVHSDSYGFCLGGDNHKSIEEAIKAGFTPVGIAGRVKINAVGPTLVGDLLMSSNFSGVAMRGNPLGAVVAKALEKLYPAEKKRIDAILTLR